MNDVEKLCKEIAGNKEVCMFGSKKDQLDAEEPRYELRIEGPERLIRKLLDTLWGMM